MWQMESIKDNIVNDPEHMTLLLVLLKWSMTMNTMKNKLINCFGLYTMTDVSEFIGSSVL